MRKKTSLIGCFQTCFARFVPTCVLLEAGISKIFGKQEKFVDAKMFTVYQMIFAGNEVLGNIETLLLPGCLLCRHLLTPGLTLYY